MQRSALCRSRRELSNAYLLAKIRVDTAENEPLEVWGKIQFNIHSPPYSHCARWYGYFGVFDQHVFSILRIHWMYAANMFHSDTMRYVERERADAVLAEKRAEVWVYILRRRTGSYGGSTIQKYFLA